jgi:hypothetical protein
MSTLEVIFASGMYTVYNLCVVKGPSMKSAKGHTSRSGQIPFLSPSRIIDLAQQSTVTFEKGDQFFVEFDVVAGPKSVASAICTYDPAYNYTCSTQGTSMSPSVLGPYILPP